MVTSKSAVVTLPSDTQILITREFDAPAHLVYRAWTTPDLIKRWWAGDRGEVTSIEVDLRVGGAWRYVMTANGGFEVAFHGVYQEVVENERLVSTEVYEAVPDDFAVNTLTLVDIGGHTTLRVLVQHNSAVARDMHVNSGMEGGMQESMDYLERVAVELAAAAR
jgi:uncharacterized protein YndB with AHSA1/START domain